MARVRLDRSEVIKNRLPSVCMQCGAPSSTYVPKKFSWNPPWCLVLILVGLLPWVIVSLALTKNMRVEAPMCEQHTNHWSRRTAFTVIGFLSVVALAILVGFLSSSLDPAMVGESFNLYLWLGVGGVFFVWLFAAAIFSQSAIRPTEITDREITLIKISPPFVEALDKDREKDYQPRQQKFPHWGQN